MVRRAEQLAWVADREAAALHLGEGVERAFVDQVAVDIEQRRAAASRASIDVAVPDLVEHRPRRDVASALYSCRPSSGASLAPCRLRLFAERREDSRAGRRPDAVVAEDVVERFAQVPMRYGMPDTQACSGMLTMRPPWRSASR